MRSPVSPASRMPFRPCPVAYHSPRSRGSAPMIGRPSGVTGRSPAQVRRTSALVRVGQSAVTAAKTRASPAEVTSGWKPAYSMVEPGDRLVAPGHQVAAAAVDDRAPGAGGPGKRRHLSPHRRHRHGPRHATDRPGPGAGRDDHVARRVPAPPARHAGHPVPPRLDRRSPRPARRSTPSRAASCRSAATSRSGSRAPSCGAQSAPRGRAEPRPPALHLVGVEPVGEMPLLPLPGHLRPQVAGFVLVRRGPGDALAPEPDVDAGGLPQRLGQRAVELPGRQSQLQERVLRLGLQLRGQHSRRRLPSLALLALGIEHQHAAPGQRQLPGAGGAYRPTTHHDNIVGSSHLYSL